MRRLSWTLSDVGRRREHNEDSFLADDVRGLYAVADGMGGHQAGDRASRMAVEILAREVCGVTDFDGAARVLAGIDPAATPYLLGAKDLRPTRPIAALSLEAAGGMPAPAAVLAAATRLAGRSIYDESMAVAEREGMGTTLTSVLFDGETAHLAHVGDSRAYLFRGLSIQQVTQDHSFVAEQIRAGLLTEAEAKDSPLKHVITRSVGVEREIDVDIFSMPVRPGDAFLLCSDGMSNYFEAHELAQIFKTTYLKKVPQTLVDIANERGGDDNITVVVVTLANEV